MGLHKCPQCCQPRSRQHMVSIKTEYDKNTGKAVRNDFRCGDCGHVWITTQRSLNR